MKYWSFHFITLLYLFALSGRDYMVTGVLAQHLPPDGRFLAYVLWTSLENQAFALLALSTEKIKSPIGVLKYLTITACWIGGWLDFIYFMIKGAIPEWSMIWHWMPFHPTTEAWAIYAACWLIGIVAAWGILAYRGAET